MDEEVDHQPDFYCHNHQETAHFAAEKFAILAQLREEDVLTDITLMAEEISTRAHKLVLMAASDYFRTMFKTCFFEADLGSLSLPGVDAAILIPLVDYFYSGKISITNDNVIALLEAASLLLLPSLLQACGRFLANGLDEANCLRVLAIATSRNFGLDLEWLEKEVVRYIQLHFEAVWRSSDDFISLLNQAQLQRLLDSDDLVIDTEENVFNCVAKWLQNSENSIIGHDELLRLWEAVRFPQLSTTFVTQVVESSPFFESAIRQTESYQNASTASRTASRTWSRSLRRRGHNMDIIVAHADGLREVEFFNTTDDDRWTKLAFMPEGCGIDGVALAGHRSKLFVVGGNSSLISEPRKQGRTCYLYGLDDNQWRPGPSLQTARWNHGLVRIGDALYAVGGCGQQDSMEALSLTDLESGWSPRPPMSVRRHVPGVAVLDGLIYVVGGADSQWNAFTTVECFHPGENVWVRLPDMHCPRAQPAVAGLRGRLYVMGGRNSKKVELKSVEIFDPASQTWTLEDEGGLRKKRWGAAAVAFRDDENLLVIGGRGKWASNSVEVFSPSTSQWALALHGLQGQDKRYTACLVTRPGDRWTCFH